MAAARRFISFAEFMEQFRQQETDSDERATLKEQVESLLPSNGQSNKKTLSMDQAPRGEKEFLVFDALIARKEIMHLFFESTFGASCMPRLLSRIEKGTLQLISLGGMALTGSLATEIFGTLADLNLELLGFLLREDYCPEVIHAFLHFLQSSVCYLALCCQHYDDLISTEALQSICTGILHSSVKHLKLVGLKVRGDVERVHEIIAEMILDSSSSIQWIQVLAHDTGDISLQLLSRAIRQHSAIQNLDISFRTKGQGDILVFDRNPWWKQLLAMDDLPLKLWPVLLEKADTWKRDASHSNLDIIYFLLREKNTEILQNVRRRRIRKRKRYGF